MKRFVILIIGLSLMFTGLLLAYGQEQKDQRGEYQKGMEAKLKEFKQKVEGLKGKAVELKGDAKKEFDEQLAKLKKKQEAANRRLEKLKSASEKSWNDLKSKMDSTMNDLEKFYDQVASKFK